MPNGAGKKGFDLPEFSRLVSGKQIIFTRHAMQRCEKRGMPEWAVRNDLQKETPKAVFEQKSENESERKFDVYYHQISDYYHRYVIVINENIRIITGMRVSKWMQKRGETNEGSKI